MQLLKSLVHHSRVIRFKYFTVQVNSMTLEILKYDKDGKSTKAPLPIYETWRRNAFVEGEEVKGILCAKCGDEIIPLKHYGDQCYLNHELVPSEGPQKIKCPTCKKTAKYKITIDPDPLIGMMVEHIRWLRHPVKVHLYTP